MLFQSSIALSLLAASFCSAAAVTTPVPASDAAKFLSSEQPFNECIDAGYDWTQCRVMAFGATVVKRGSPHVTDPDAAPTDVTAYDAISNDVGAPDKTAFYDGQSRCYPKVPGTNWVSSSNIGDDEISKLYSGAIGKVVDIAGITLSKTAFGKFVDKVKGFYNRNAGPIIKASGIQLALSLFNYAKIPKAVV